MVKYVFWLVLMTLLVSLSFATLVVTPQSSIVNVGGVLPVGVTYLDESGKPTNGILKAEASVGGFYEINLIFDGIPIEGSATINYLAPYKEGEATIMFTVGDESTEISVKIKEEKITGSKIGIKVEDFYGNAAYKKADSEIWKPLDSNVKLHEGDSLLTMKDSYVVLRFPNDSETKVLENTQLKIEKMEKVGDGYVIELKQLKGKTYNSIQKLLKAGERFLIKTDSVTAGVRGTKFSVVYEDNKPKIITFEGTVFAYTPTGFVYPVPAGAEYAPGMTKPTKSTHTEKEFETRKMKEEKKEEKKPAEEKKNKGEKKETSSESAGVSVGKPALFVGTVKKNTMDYMVYSISHSFRIGPVWLDLGINAYTNKIGGELYYGLPSSTPSTNVLDALTINGVGLFFGENYIKYGNMLSYDLGMGYALRGYSVPNAKAFDTQIGHNGYKLYLHIPYELTKLSSLEFNQSDSLWFGEITVPVLGLEAFVSGIYDTCVSTPATDQLFVDKAVSIGVRKPMFSGNIGIELNGELAKDGGFAYGAFGGYHGRLDIFEFIAGAFASFSGHHQFLFNRSYYEKKLLGQTPGIYIDGRSTFGYIVGAEVYWTYLKGKIYLNGDFSRNVTLDGTVRGVVPALGDKFSGLILTGYIYDETPFKDGKFSVLEMGGDTVAWLSVSYPIIGDTLTAGFKLVWNPDTGDWDKYISIGADMWR